ncbi:MAG TPA: hypothetical protein VKT72_03880 [Candidatus Baltobacteraceae bacterium]|nr:hypothetical protein [Candidatus Baltobacteraceae bacterium]
MLALLTLVAALQASPAPASTTTSPPAATAPAEDPAITKLARAQYDAFSSGKLDASQYSVPIPQDAITQVQAGLTSLGPVKSVQFVKSVAVKGSNVYVYKFTCANGAALEQLSVKDGKINGIYFRPVQ